MAASRTQDIRNIALLGHGGAGKTTLGEAMLHAAKVTGRLGSVDDGTSVLDFSDIEKDRKHSVDPSLGHFDHAGKTINMIDTPGYSDFIGGALSAMAGCDTAVVVISASAGIEIGTRRMFAASGQAGKARAIIINKIDAENVELERLMASITETFGSACKPMNLPSGGYSAVVDCFMNESGETDFGDVAEAHTELVENVVESDEELMDAYLGGEDVSKDRLSAAFAQAMVAGSVVPILFTSGKGDVGVAEVMDAVAGYFPSPADMPPTTVRSSGDDDAEAVDLTADPDGEFVAQAFKITADPFVGKLAWVRILQGTATGDTTYHLRDEKKSAKIGHILKVLGKDTDECQQAIVGDIIALAKVEDIRTGDTLHTAATPMFCAMPPLPTPMFSQAVAPKSRGDEQKISGALYKLAEEDPTFRIALDSQTHEMVISGVGDLHLRLMLTKMKQRYDIEVDTKPPKIPYKETVTAKAKGHHRHKKQTGGSGQFGEVYLEVEPLELGEGFDFVNKLFGESIPRQYLPAIEKGVRDVLTTGPVAGYPMQDIRVSVYDGKHHPVDSKEIAFRTAGKLAFVDAIRNAKPVLLEPFVDMEITIPASYMGDIASDLSGRRGRILGQDMLPGNICTVKAQAPLSEVMQYNSQLRSVTGGQGSYSMDLSHYEPVPGNVQQAIVAAAAKDKEEDK